MKNNHNSASTTRDKPLKAAGHIHLEHAHVLGNEGNMFVIATAGGEVRMAAKAESCLLLPENGDLVLVSIAGNSASHVLSVLSRNDQNQTQRCLDLGEGARITSKEGSISIVGENLHCQARQHADFSAENLRFAAAYGQASFIRFKLAAKTLQSVTDSARLVARNVDQRVGRFMQRLGNCYRRIQGMEHVIAEQVSLHVRQRLTQKAKNASLEAEENVTINAEHIDLG